MTSRRDHRQSHAIRLASGPRAGDGNPPLGPKAIGRAAGGQAPLTPAVTPVHEPAAIPLVVGSGRLDEGLPPAAFATPDAGQGGMAGARDLLLEVDIGMGQEAPQLCPSGRHFSEEIGRDECGHGWRGRRARPSQDHRHPQAFPT